MINWKEMYERTLKNICEADGKEFDEIVEIEEPDYTVELVENPNAKENALYSFKLDDEATEEDYKKFVEYIYGYIGEDINDYLSNDETPDLNKENEGNDMAEEKKIRELLKRYGASDIEIENFMTDLYETKDDIKDDMEDSIEEDDDFNYLDGDTMAKLKATEEGQNLIINAPKMAKDELKKAITEYLSKQS